MQSFYFHLPNLSPFHLAAALVSSNDHINEDWDWIDHRKPNDACSKLDKKIKSPRNYSSQRLATIMLVTVYYGSLIPHINFSNSQATS